MNIMPTIGIISSNREDHILNGKDHRHNIHLIGKTTYLMGKTIGIILSNREDHILRGKDRRHHIHLIGKTTYSGSKKCLNVYAFSCNCMIVRQSVEISQDYRDMS